MLAVVNVCINTLYGVPVKSSVVSFSGASDHWGDRTNALHYNDVVMGAISSQITSLTIVYSTVYSDADLRKHQSSASLAFVRGIHRGLVNSPHKWPVTRKMFPFDDVNMLPAQSDQNHAIIHTFSGNLSFVSIPKYLGCFRNIAVLSYKNIGHIAKCVNG